MNWINNQIEAHARNIQTPADVVAWHNKSKLDLTELIERHRIPQGLVEMTPNPAIDWRFSSQWMWEEFKQKTFWGCKFYDIEAAKTPYSHWNELIGLIANTVASSRVVMNSKM